jgi:hypothetical protein
MANMSYCRFDNTVSDLMDCYNNLDQFDSGELSKREAKAAYRLIKLAMEIAANYDLEELEEIYAEYKEEE